MKEKTNYIAGLYCRLSKDDEQKGESVSIGTQRSILKEYCLQQGYTIYKVYIDDGYSGLNFNRPGFKELLKDVERGAVNMVITKDLSRLGRDYIMTGYYSEIFFQTKGVRYIALADDVDSLKGTNEIAPFKNILNEMYARDVSKKVKNAKQQRAKQGLFIGSQAPYGYQKDPNNKSQLIIDPEAAEVVSQIFSLALDGLGSVAIASELKKRNIPTPAVYKYQHGDQRFARYSSIQNSDYYSWRSATISQILTNRVYIGELISLKTETQNCKTKQRSVIPEDQRVVIPNAHDAIISATMFDQVQVIRSQHRCPAKYQRENIFRGKLFCECCGHPLTISKKKLVDREVDVYVCMYHYRHPDVCSQTHQVYHDTLCSYILQQIQYFARSIKRKKVNLVIKDYALLEVLSAKVISDVIDRIEIGNITRKSKLKNVIHIYWKFT